MMEFEPHWRGTHVDMVHQREFNELFDSAFADHGKEYRAKILIEIKKFAVLLKIIQQLLEECKARGTANADGTMSLDFEWPERGASVPLWVKGIVQLWGEMLYRGPGANIGMSNRFARGFFRKGNEMWTSTKDPMEDKPHNLLLIPIGLWAIEVLRGQNTLAAADWSTIHPAVKEALKRHFGDIADLLGPAPLDVAPKYMKPADDALPRQTARQSAKSSAHSKTDSSSSKGKGRGDSGASILNGRKAGGKSKVFPISNSNISTFIHGYPVARISARPRSRVDKGRDTEEGSTAIVVQKDHEHDLDLLWAPSPWKGQKTLTLRQILPSERSIVYRAEWDGQPVVVKKAVGEEQKDDLYGEVEIYKHLEAAKAGGHLVPKPLAYFNLGTDMALFVMSYEGQPLTTIYDNGHRLLPSVYDAVKKLHAFGILHEDVEASNVLLNPRDGKLRFIDFASAFKHDCDGHCFELEELNPKRRPIYEQLGGRLKRQPLQ